MSRIEDIEKRLRAAREDAAERSFAASSPTEAALLDDVAFLLGELKSLAAERDEADRRAGAAERRLAHAEESAVARSQWLSKAKREWGVDDRVSFDDVWRQALALKQVSKLVDIAAEIESLRKNYSAEPGTVNYATIRHALSEMSGIPAMAVVTMEHVEAVKAKVGRLAAALVDAADVITDVAPTGLETATFLSVHAKALADAREAASGGEV
jgi:hypothetical protein